MINPFSTAPHLVDELVLLTQLTADINVIPRFRRKPPTELSSEIDTNECLQILQLVACGCRRRREDIERFWRSMRFDFILMMLRNVQPIEDIELILTLLRTSTLEDSFAMRVAPQEADQSISEMHVIDRVSAMLIEIPKVAEGEEPYDAVEIAEMRLEVLGLMEKICDNKHGGEAMARNPFAIGRLVRVMNDELHALYQYKYGHEHRYVILFFINRFSFIVESHGTPMSESVVQLSSMDLNQELFALHFSSRKYTQFDSQWRVHGFRSSTLIRG